MLKRMSHSYDFPSFFWVISLHKPLSSLTFDINSALPFTILSSKSGQERMKATEIFPPPNKGDDSDEGFRFNKSLQELRDLRYQLHYAADYCETTFLNSEEKQAVLENTKEYISKAVVTFVDHLGNVSASLNHCISKTNAFSEAELRINCLKQRLLSCQDFAHKLALTRVKWNPNLPRHHRRYLSAPTMATVEKSNDDSRVSIPPSPARLIDKSSTNKPSSLRYNFDECDSDSALVPVHDGLSSKSSNPTFHFQQDNKKLGRKRFYRKPLQSADILSFIRRGRRSAA